MAAEYLHGAEVIEINRGPVAIKTARTAVIGLVGIAPVVTDAADSPLLVLTPEDKAALGSEVPGFTIPQALTDIFAQGYTTVIVVNAFALSMLTNVVDEVHELADNGDGNLKVILSFAHIKAGGAISFKDGDDAAVLLVEGTDYEVDDFGKIIVYADNVGTLGEGDTLKVTYKKLDTTAVTSSVIVGDYDEETDTYTGIQAWDLSMSKFNFHPKLLIAPGHESATVQAALQTKAAKYRAHYIQDLPADTDFTVTDAIAERGPANTADLFFTSSARCIPVFPYLKRELPATGAEGIRQHAAYLAGLICQTDLLDGYWFSSSNRQYNGTTGPRRTISFAINDPLCQANQLNAAGIVTVASAFGTGYRSFGNRSAAYPASTKPENFYCVRRTADVIYDSIELAMLEWLDKPLTKPTIDAIRESVNEFIRTLIGRGALVDGACLFEAAKNPGSELSLGHVTFTIAIMPPTPAERITFEAFIDVSLLKALTAGS